MTTQFNPASYATALGAMTEDEVFAEMQSLEQKSEAGAKGDRQALEDILAQIALVEDEIERRFPGQALAPYKQWQKVHLI